MTDTHLHAEFRDACRRLLACKAIEVSDTLPIEKRIMIHHGIAELFPVGSAEHNEAKQTALALATAEKRQLELNRLLTGFTQSTPTH